MSTGTPFRPLDFIRGVIADSGLSTTEKAVLVAMSMGTDNSTSKVRRSLSRIARDASCSRKYVGDLIEKPSMSRYFAKVDRPNPRRVDVWLNQEPTCELSSHEPEAHPEGQHANSVAMTCELSSQDMRTQFSPSAPASAGVSAEGTDEPLEEILTDEVEDSAKSPVRPPKARRVSGGFIIIDSDELLNAFTFVDSNGNRVAQEKVIYRSKLGTRTKALPGDEIPEITFAA